MVKLKLCAVAALLIGACSAETVSDTQVIDTTLADRELTPDEAAEFARNVGVSVEALGQPVAYTKINSNGGVAICPLQGTLCQPTAALGMRAHRAVRSIVQSLNPNAGPNAWDCPVGGTTCTRTSNQHKAAVGRCTPAGSCRFVICVPGGFCNIDVQWEADVGLDSSGQSAIFWFEDGGLGQANFAGNVFWYSPPN